MSELDFAAVARIKDTLAQAPLEDLVAVFSRAWDPQLLLVYNNDAEVQAETNNCRAISLDDQPEPIDGLPRNNQHMTAI